MTVDDLLREAAAGEGTDAVGFGEPLDDAGADAARAAIAERADGSRFLVLLALRRDRPENYSEVPEDVRASILADALRTRTYLNDFGGLAGEGWFGLAGEALLQLGRAAVSALAPLLDDAAEAPLYGSETAMVAADEGWRRADYAARYIELALDGHAVYDPDPAVRDAQIHELRARLPS